MNSTGSNPLDNPEIYRSLVKFRQQKNSNYAETQKRLQWFEDYQRAEQQKKIKAFEKQLQETRDRDRLWELEQAAKRKQADRERQQSDPVYYEYMRQETQKRLDAFNREQTRQRLSSLR